jgi:hypothetical protein
MKAAFAAARFWGRRPTVHGLTAGWPTVRLGAIGEAWQLYKRHWIVWSVTMLVSVASSVFLQWLTTNFLHIASGGMFGGFIGLHPPGMPLVPTIVSAMIGGFFLGGMMRMAVSQVRGRAPRVGDLFSVTDVWFDLVLGSALLGLVVSLGLSLFVIPGLIASGLLFLTHPLIVDGRLPATGAIIQSFHVLKSQWVLATVVHLAFAFVAGLGILAFGIGWLITGPLYVLSVAVLYRDFFLAARSPL